MTPDQIAQAVTKFTPDNLSAYFLFFVPGFIAMQVGALLVPLSDTDFSKRIPVAVGYSALNFALMSIVLTILHYVGWTWASAGIKFAFLFVVPVLYPFLFKKVRERQLFGITTPFPTAWDEFFSKRREYWVRIHLKDSDKILTCWYGQPDSAASQYPEEQQLYMSEIWESNAQGVMQRVERTAGILVNMSEVKYLEFLI